MNIENITRCITVADALQSDSEEEEDNEEEEEVEEEFDSEDGEEEEMSSQSSANHYPSRNTRLTRNSATGDRKRTGKGYLILGEKMYSR